MYLMSCAWLYGHYYVNIYVFLFMRAILITVCALINKSIHNPKNNICTNLNITIGVQIYAWPISLLSHLVLSTTQLLQKKKKVLKSVSRPIYIFDENVFCLIGLKHIDTTI